MIYDQANQALYTDARELIKEFDCPLTKAWNHLSLTENNFVRYCGSCSKDVLDITSFNEQQIIAITRAFPDQCAYINFAETEHSIDVQGDPPVCSGVCADSIHDMPYIQTARGIDAINDAVKDGFLVDIRETDVMGAICHHNRWVKQEDGSIRHADQYSELGNFFTTHPQGFLGAPVSAYIIPVNLKPGAKVYVTDVIEHIVERAHHSEYRLRHGTGIWDGHAIVIDTPDVEYVIG